MSGTFQPEPDSDAGDPLVLARLAQRMWRPRHVPLGVMAGVFLSVLCIGLADAFVLHVRFTLLYFIPLFLGAWLFPLRLALFLAFWTAVLWLFGLTEGTLPSTADEELLFLLLSSMVKLATFVFFVLVAAFIQTLVQEQHRLITALRSAHFEIEELRDMIPICFKCRKIRDPRGNWQRIEEYFRKHQGIHVTHGLCEDCAQEVMQSLHPHKNDPAAGLADNA